VILPNEHHYVRYCKPTQIEGGQVLPEAFCLQEKDSDGGVSGDHFEHYPNDNYRQILKSLIDPPPTGRGYKGLKNNGCFAKVNCGEVINTAKAVDVCEISFVKEDEKQSHTLMTGLTVNDNLIPMLLVTFIKETMCVGAIK